MSLNKEILALVVTAISCTMAATSGSAQELEPRAYRTMPTGINAVAIVYGYSTGNVVSEPSTPIKDLQAETNSLVLGYLRSFGMFGRSASVMVSVPYLYMEASAIVDGSYLGGHRSAWATPRARLAVNLIGGPALSPKAFAQYKQGRNLGISLTVAPPGGQYSSNFLINFGTNRWAVKPEIGYSSIQGKWIFEGAAGVWFFTDNSNGYGGTNVRQDPIGGVQAHLSYNFTPSMWMAIDANYFTGGRSYIDGLRQGDLQKNSRVGLTFSLPLQKRTSLQLAAHTGAFTSIGADFDVFSATYQVVW